MDLIFKKNDLLIHVKLCQRHSFSRSESENEMAGDREREVKMKKNSREFSRNENLAGLCTEGGSKCQTKGQTMKISCICILKKERCSKEGLMGYGSEKRGEGDKI